MFIKNVINKTVLFGLLLVLLVSGCNRNEEDVTKANRLQAPIQNAEQLSKLFLLEPLQLHRVEVASEALSVWRQYSAQNPTLLLMSNNPMLTPVPEALRAETASMLNSDTQAEIAERSSLRRSDPLMLPVMTVDAALRNGWFDKLLWALPMRDASLELSQEKFSQQLQESGIATEDELSTVAVTDNQVKGILRGMPFVAVALANIPEITSPAIVHFDQSYFQKMYKNEISTPIFPLVYETLKELHYRVKSLILNL
jgi:hypothetical protein